MSVTRDESVVLENLRKYALRLRLEEKADSTDDWDEPEGPSPETGRRQRCLEEKGIPRPSMCATSMKERRVVSKGQWAEARGQTRKVECHLGKTYLVDIEAESVTVSEK